MSKKRHKLLVFIIALPLIFFVLLEIRFFYDYSNSRRDPSRFVLPTAFQGWAVVEYGNPDCPDLKKENGFWNHSLSQDGEFCTSRAIQGGWASDEFVYADQPNRNLNANPQMGQNLIWEDSTHEINVPNQRKRIFYVFYVGQKLSRKEEVKQLQIIDERIQAKIKIAH